MSPTCRRIIDLDAYRRAEAGGYDMDYEMTTADLRRLPDGARAASPQTEANWLAYRCLIAAIRLDDVIAWHDADERSHAEVIAAFDEAIAISNVTAQNQ